MTLKYETFWYKIYTCDYCGAETDDPFIDDEGDDLCDKCAQNFVGSLSYLFAVEKMQQLRSRKREAIKESSLPLQTI